MAGEVVEAIVLCCCVYEVGDELMPWNFAAPNGGVEGLQWRGGGRWRGVLEEDFEECWQGMNFFGGWCSTVHHFFVARGGEGINNTGWLLGGTCRKEDGTHEADCNEVHWWEGTKEADDGQGTEGKN